MRPRRQGIILAEIIAFITVLGVIFAVFNNYPTIHIVTQGAKEASPLKLIDRQRSYIQFENVGPMAVIISVEFSSNGSIRFENDYGQITDTFQVSYVVKPNTESKFPFTPIINNSVKNATLFIKYSSKLEALQILSPRNPEAQWLSIYKKTFPEGTQWELIESKPI